MKVTNMNAEYKYDHMFVQVPFGLFRAPELYKILNECIPIYNYIQSRIFRKEHGADRYNLYNTYFKVGILASAVSVEELADVHRCCEKIVRRRRDLLLEHGFMEAYYKTIMIKNKKGQLVQAKPYIYILGQQIDGKPYYYAADVVKACKHMVDTDSYIGVP